MTVAQKDIQRVGKLGAFVMLQWFGQVEINRRETARTPVHSFAPCAKVATGTHRDKNQIPLAHPLFTLWTAEPAKGVDYFPTWIFLLNKMTQYYRKWGRIKNS